jgi:eukaryotic-like serine/threonine-protein kinase
MASRVATEIAAPTGIRHCASCRAIYRQDFQRCPLDGAPLVIAATDPWLGAIVGSHYVIEALVGEGAMGRVYRAHHCDLPSRLYAVKILIGDLAATAQMRARFQLEAENASRLAHPNVVGIIDFGATEHGVTYIVMELVDGPTLGALLRQAAMEPERVLRIARQLAEGLEHAHGRGMIHRDFKPDNILVVGEGGLEVARIADFGLALSTTNDIRLTTTGVVCTPAYAAPEQLRGAPLDHRVDLYALGTTMFEMLSGGTLPFNSDDVDTSVRTKLAGDAPSILMVAPSTPPALVAIIGRLLATAPERRPQSARAVIRAIDSALAAPHAGLRTEQTAPLRVPRAAIEAALDGAADSSPHVEAPRRPTKRQPRAERWTAKHADKSAKLAANVAAKAARTATDAKVAQAATAGDVAPARPDVAMPATAAPARERMRTADASPAAIKRDAATRKRHRRDTPVDELMPAPSGRFRRAAIQLFACGIALGGVLAWLDLRASSASVPRISFVAAVAEQPEPPEPTPASEGQSATSPLVVEVVPDAPAPATEPATAPAEQAADMAHVDDAPPVPTIDDAPAATTIHVSTRRSTKTPSGRKRRMASRVSTVSGSELAMLAVGEHDGAGEETSVDPRSLALKYSVIGRELRRLDQLLGRENTDDLWAAYRAIRITEAMATRASRQETAESLSTIYDAIVERRALQ